MVIASHPKSAAQTVLVQAQLACKGDPTRGMFSLRLPEPILFDWSNVSIDLSLMTNNMTPSEQLNPTEMKDIHLRSPTPSSNGFRIIVPDQRQSTLTMEVTAEDEYQAVLE